MKSPEQLLFDAFPGEWSLSRTIPGIGAATGTAWFVPVGPAQLRYLEEGSFVPARGPATRIRQEHLYSLEPEGIRVATALGRTLHRLRLRAPGADPWPLDATDVHECVADTYTGRYRFESERRFTVTMRVRGPRKDYLIRSTLERGGA